MYGSRPCFAPRILQGDEHESRMRATGRMGRSFVSGPNAPGK